MVQVQVDEAVKILKDLKTEFKQKTGEEYKPGKSPVVVAEAVTPARVVCSTEASGLEEKTLYSKVAEQGEVVRKLKAEKVSKVTQ